MNLRQPALAALLSIAACGSALATVVVTPNGSTTTYFEDFNGGSSFAGGAWLNVPFSGDDHLWLSSLAPTASFTFTSLASIASLTLDFWYSVPSGGNGEVTLASLAPVGLGDTPGNALSFIANNPGAGGSSADALYSSSTITNLAAGEYTLTFSKVGGAFNSMKVDDVSLSVTAVPEPETYLLMLAGLSVIGFVARRRRPNRA